MRAAAAAAAAAEQAKQWLESSASKARSNPRTKQLWEGGGFFHSIFLSSLSISRCSAGHVSCSFRVPPHLTDEEGNWEAGPIAALMDDVGAAAIMTVVGHIKISVDFAISYYSPAKINEEVEIEARMGEHVGKLTMVTVEIRKKGSGRMVALGRQWMASSRLAQRQRKSHL